MGGGRRRPPRPAGGARLGPALQPPHDAGGGLPRQAGDDHRAVERRPARSATAPAPRAAPSPRPARPARGTARCGRSRASSPSSAPARPAAGAARSSRTPARPAPAPAGCARTARSASTSRPGVETGTRIRLAGEGEAGLRGGPAGDLYIFIEVEQHPIFERDNQNLYCRIPVVDDHRGARRRDRRPDPRRRQDPGQGAGGRAVGQAAPPARQGHAGAARRRGGRPLHRARASRRR